MRIGGATMQRSELLEAAPILIMLSSRQVAVVFTVVGGISIILFLIGQITLYVPSGGID